MDHQEQPVDESTQTITFSDEQQAHIDALIQQTKTEWETEFLTPLVTERNELKSKIPVERTESERQFEEREAALTQKEIKVSFQEAGYSDFADLVKVDSVENVQEVVKTITDILNARKVDASYQPEDHKSQTPYENASSKNDVLGMIGTKLQQAFNKN